MTEQNSAFIPSSQSSMYLPPSWDEATETDSFHGQHLNLRKKSHSATTKWHPLEQENEASRYISASHDSLKQTSGHTQLSDSSALANHEFRRLESLKEDFLSTVSHELKTPLSSMYLSIRLLESLLHESEEFQHPIGKAELAQSQKDKVMRCLETLAKECKKEIALVNNLLTLQESIVTLPSPALTCIFLHEWLHDFLKPFKKQFKTKKHTFQCHISSSIPYIVSDRIRLEKILQELITNAYKFTPERGCVSLSILKQDNAIIMTVLSKSEAIPHDEIPHLFNVFHRVPKTDPWKTGGTGIGLALVKKLTETLGGEIRVDTGSFGNAFTVCLPILAMDVETQVGA